MKLPRDLLGPELIRLLDKLGYVATRQGDDFARDFGAYSVRFDGKPLAIREGLDVASNVKLIRRC